MTNHNSADMTDISSTDSALLAQSFKAPFPNTCLTVQIPITALYLSTCKAGDKNADSAWLRLVYADIEDILRSVCVAAYRVPVDATWLGCRKNKVLNKPANSSSCDI